MVNSPNLQVRETIELRIFTLDDAEEFFEVTTKNNTYLREWLWWLDDDKNVEDVKKYIVGSEKRREENEGIDWCIWNDNYIIGGIGLFPWDTTNKKTSLTYWLAEDFQGKGIMYDSLKIIIHYIFTELHIHRIEITCALGNNKSSALPKKLGFTFEWISRESCWLYDHFVDMEIYSLLSSEWQK